MKPDVQWYFKAWRGRTHWIGMAKLEPFTGRSPMDEPGDLWFEFGDTEEEAIAKIRAEVEQLQIEGKD